MAENIKFKVSYVKITDEGMERINNVFLDDLTHEDRKDIKSLTFLPINSKKVRNIAEVLKDFPILEYLYLPSTMTVDIKDVTKECPMLKSLMLLSANNVANSLSQSVVKVNAEELEGDNTAEFRTFVTTTKDNRQVFEVNAKQVQNKAIEIVEEKVEYLSITHVNDYISGEKGIALGIDTINEAIEDSRCKIDISAEVLDSLLSLFVEKGVTFEEFTIDFSKLYDKIESYKTIVKNVNQVSIKEEIEGNIVEAYQNTQRIHYENLLKKLSSTANKLCKGVTLTSEERLLNDLMTYITSVVVESPEFPADEYKEDGALNSLLDYLPTTVSRHVKSSKERGLLRKYLAQAVSMLKTDKQLLVSKIDARLDAKTSLEHARDTFATKFGLDPSKKQSQKLMDTFVDALVEKNFGTLTKQDVLGAIDQIREELKNGEVQGRKLLELITNTVLEFPTDYEIKEVVVDFIADNGYDAINVTID